MHKSDAKRIKSLRRTAAVARQSAATARAFDLERDARAFEHSAAVAEAWACEIEQKALGKIKQAAEDRR